MDLEHNRTHRSPPSPHTSAAQDRSCGERMDSMTFHHDTVLSDVHMLQPRARRLMTRLNRVGQPVFISKFKILSLDHVQDPDSSEEWGNLVTESTEERNGGGCPSSVDKQVSGGDLGNAVSPEEDQDLLLDEDGDFELTRRRPRRQAPECGRDEVCPVLLRRTDSQDPENSEEDDTVESADIVRIEHTMATVLEDVGKQVWRGALLLADFILSEPRTFRGATVLELGAGTGLTSILTASVAKRVYCTDVGEDLLSMCRSNVLLNKRAMECSGGEVIVRKLNWLERDLCTDPEEEFSWKEDEVADLYDNTTVIIAADMVYDDDLTDAFFRTLYQLCSSFNHTCDIYISIEKRLNFTLRHMEVCCEAYQHFHRCLQQLQDLQGLHSFSAQRMAPSFPQSLMYERVEQLELWKVTASYTSSLQKTSTDHH